MKVHAMYGLDLPTTNASGAGALAPLQTRFPNGPWQTYIVNTEINLAVSIFTDKWVRMDVSAGQYNYGNYRFRMSADIKEMVPSVGPTSNLWFGVRVKPSSTYTGNGLVHLTSVIEITNMFDIVTKADIPGFVFDKPYYVEFNLNFATNTVKRRVDGKPLSDLIMPAWMATAVSASPGGTSVCVGIGHNAQYNITQGQTHTFFWRDFFCVEWESGELAQFLGPQIVEKVPVSAVSAPTWTASAGDATSVLKTGYSNPSTGIATPTLTTDDAMTPASITYNASAIPQNAVINGVHVKGRSAVTAATTGNLGVSLTVGGVETPDATTPMVAAQTFYDRIFSAPKTPAGNPWYQPNLAGLTVKLKPKV